MKTQRVPRRGMDRSSALIRSFDYALMGIRHALRSERNLRIHCLLTVAYAAGCLIVRPSLADVTLGIVMCCLVWAGELLNTAVERVTDLTAAGRQHELARQAKDVSAGAVLLIALGAVSVGYYLVVKTLPWHWLLLTTVNLEGAVESCTVLVLVVAVVLFSRRPSIPPKAPQPDSSKEVKH